MICMILGYELKALDSMKSLWLWFVRTILDLELKALDATNNSGLWMT